MASGLVSYCGGLGVCRLVLGVQSQAPHCGTYMPMGSRPSGQLASERLLLRTGLKPVAKRITSVELSTAHMTLCSYVPWGRGGCPQATIARVKYSLSEHLVSAFWKGPSILLGESSRSKGN